MHFIRARSSKTHRGESETIYHKETHNGCKHRQRKSLFILAGITLWAMDVCVYERVYTHAYLEGTHSLSTFACLRMQGNDDGTVDVLIDISILSIGRFEI